MNRTWIIEASALKESFMDFESGKASATSGSNKIKFAP